MDIWTVVDWLVGGILGTAIIVLLALLILTRNIHPYDFGDED